MTGVMPRSGHPPDEAELARLEAEERELARRIAEISALPDQLRREAEERAVTLPPPDDLADRRRQREFDAKASRGQVRNERRAQGRSLILTIFLIASVVALVAWVLKLAEN
jgi:hypothetical protein